MSLVARLVPARGDLRRGRRRGGFPPPFASAGTAMSSSSPSRESESTPMSHEHRQLYHGYHGWHETAEPPGLSAFSQSSVGAAHQQIRLVQSSPLHHEEVTSSLARKPTHPTHLRLRISATLYSRNPAEGCAVDFSQIVPSFHHESQPTRPSGPRAER